MKFLLRRPSWAVFVLLFVSGVSSAAPKFPIKVLGEDEKSFTPETGNSPVLEDPSEPDVVVVGGGLAGLSASIFLTDQKKSVLLLEKEGSLGGLARGGSVEGTTISYDRGAAYWTSAYEEEQKILERLGLGDFEKTNAISEPADSYLWNGKLYLGLWEEETLKELPASFALFKHQLEKADHDKLIPNQPIEDSSKKLLKKMDTLTAAQWIRKMPGVIKKSKETAAKVIYERFLKEKLDQKSDPMGDVIALLDVFCRSALGGNSDQISAVAFANFYISEITTRFTTPIGTASAAKAMGHILREYLDTQGTATTPLFDVKIRATVTKIDSLVDSVVVTYLKDGKLYRVRSKYAIFAGQLKFLPKILTGLALKDPQRKRVIDQLDYAHYSVHGVFVKGHPYRATYDTWVRSADYSMNDFTDVILGRWVDPKINGYLGMRDFTKHPADDVGILTIYQHLNPKLLGKGFSADQARGLAEGSVNRMVSLFDPILSEKWGTSIDVLRVETMRWPYSIHIAKPGHFSVDAKVLKKPFGRVYFANNNMGTPAFEEALYRGHCAANNVLKRLDPKFLQEKWTKCKIEAENRLSLD